MKETTPLSLKLEPEVHTRLMECATRTRIKKYALALMAIEAAVTAIERNNYKLVVPIEFEVTHEATPKKAGKPRPANPRRNHAGSSIT